MSLRASMVAWLALPLLVALPAHGVEPIQVEAAWVNVRGAVFEVNARVIYADDQRVRTALEDGATVQFELQAVVEKQHRYWWDTTVVDVMLRRALSRNALTERYELKELPAGELRTFATLEESLMAAGEVVDWPVVLEPQLDPQSNYRMRVRAGYRRGNMPPSLQALLPWSDGWNRRSEWSSWILPR
jgi:hypothetical protein